MATRLELQDRLEKLLESRHVYYEPPESLKMEYPAIVYSKNNIITVKTNNHIYKKDTRYTVIVIDKRPDNSVIDKLLDMPYCSHDRTYKSENLYHDVFTVYF